MLTNNRNNKKALMRLLRNAVVSTSIFLFAAVPFAHADALGDALNIIGGIFYWIALGIGGLFVGMGGLALDETFRLLVLDMGKFFQGGYGLGVMKAWEIIRDVFNIVFIFSFIFLGIKTILNSEDSNTRRSIGYLIIAALFINFSLFITQAIVDFSNIAATQIYNQVITAGSVGASEYEDDIISTSKGSITGAFLQVSSLTTFFGKDSEKSKDGSKLIVYSIVLLVFLVMAGIIFLFGAYHLIYRFVALSIYMILSPVLFLGMILPNFKKFTDQWIRGLLKQSFFAPAFLFLIYVSLSTLDKLKSEIMPANMAYDFSGITDGGGMEVDGFTIFIFFGIVIGFLYASVKVGELMSISGAKTAMGALSKTRQMTQRALGNTVLGGIGGALRDNVGRRAHEYAESDTAKNRASRGGLSGKVGRIGLRASRVVGDTSFDVRQVGGLGEKAGIGGGLKGGYKTRTEAIEKEEKEFAKSLGEIGDDDATIISYTNDKKEKEKELDKLKDSRKKIRNVELENRLDELEKAKLNIDKDDKKGQEANLAEIQKTKKAIKDYEQDEQTRIDTAIKQTETSIKEAELKIKREKNRRQIGTASDVAAEAEASKKLKENARQIDNLNRAYTAARDAGDQEEKKRLAGAIKEANNERKVLAQAAKEASYTLGYAGVLEKREWYGSMALGRVVHQDRNAGKAIRKQYEKAVKKTKEEERDEKLSESLAKASKN